MSNEAEAKNQVGAINSYKDLIIWQRGMGLVETVYRTTAKLPASEQWGLASQMRRAVVSVPSNIAEGCGRQATGEYRRSLSISRGSLLELETQVLLCQKLGYLAQTETDGTVDEIQQISRMIASVIPRIR